jgi:hypothetical protein
VNPNVPQVGAPDPELKNSPILDEFDEDIEAGSRELELQEGVCYFNGASYPLGTSVHSGSEVLECSAGGVWIRKAEREGPTPRGA